MQSGTDSRWAHQFDVRLDRMNAIQRWIARLGLATSVTVALAIPVVYLASSHHSIHQLLSFKTELNAGRIAKYIYTHGSLWQFHRVRLNELVELPSDTPLAQSIYTQSGKLVTEVGEDLAFPVVSHSAPIVVNGKIEGRIDIATSARPLAVRVMGLTAASLLLGLVIYVLLNRVPLRLLDRAFAAVRRHQEELSEQNARFDAALENMSQGLSMFDSEQRLVICNSYYAELYGLDAESTKPGTPLKAILEHRAATGSCPVDADAYVEERLGEASAGKSYMTEDQLRDGRVISVTHQPMSNGGWVAIHVDITERKRAESEIAYLAHHDVLTDLPNRVQLRQHIDKSLSALQDGKSIAILGLDLDYFKNVNDSLGHPFGDALLRAVSERLRSCLRDTDFVARTGGDEFSIVQVGAMQPDSASTLAERLVTAMSAPFDLGEHHIVIGTSVGITIAPADGVDPDVLLKQADLALYRAKADGRNTFAFFEPEMDARVQARRKLEVDLRQAIAAGEFELFYQPIVSLRDKKVSCFEALLRWNHPTRGRMSPDQFIPLAEETGLIVPIGDWVIRQACAQAATWPADIRVAVNLSPVQFRSKALVATVMSAMAAARLTPNRLEVEITESVLLQNNESTLAVLHQLRDLGVRTAMDDFGTGYSSLSYLRSFPFDKIKIDKSFLTDLADKPESIAIVRAITGLGQSFNMTTTAEGVETEDQLQHLRAQGCTEIQGYLFSKPRPASQIAEFLARFELQIEAAA